MSLLLFLSLSAALCGAVAAAELPPILFLAGYGGNKLWATIAEDADLPPSCADQSLPVNKPFEVLNNAILADKPCVYDLVSLDYDDKTESYSSPWRGVTISTNHFGSFESLESNYWSFATSAKAWGYTLHRNLFAIPYDFRFLSEKNLQRVGFISQLKAFVERVYLENNHRKVLLLGHSNGGPTMYTFLSSPLISTAWKEKYIAAMVPLSGNLLGQMNAIRPYVYHDNPAKQELVCSWEATYGSLPWGGYEGVRDIPIVTTFAGTAQEKNYTARLDDLVALFDHVKRPQWSARMRAMYPAMDRSAHPQVDVYCLYGSEIDTEYAYLFPGDVGNNEEYVAMRTMSGDDNQDIVDNAFCNVWQRDRSVSVGKYRFEAQAFPGVHHMEMISNEDVMRKIQSIVAVYSS